MITRRRRKLLGVLLHTLVGSITVISVMALVCIVVVMVTKGGAMLTWEFLSQPSRAFGAEGGIRSQIAGTLILAMGAGLLSLPIALGTALYQSEYLAPLPIPHPSPMDARLLERATVYVSVGW